MDMDKPAGLTDSELMRIQDEDCKCRRMGYWIGAHHPLCDGADQQPAAQAAGLTDEQIEEVWSGVEWKDLSPVHEGFEKALRLRFARALLSRIDTGQIRQDGYRDGFKAAQIMLILRRNLAPSGDLVAKHVSWLRQCLREAGHCIDGGKCHHRCGSRGKCFRELNCAPLSKSGLGPGWELPSAQQAEPSEYPCMSCADCVEGSPHMCPYKGPTQASVSGEQPAEEARGVDELRQRFERIKRLALDAGAPTALSVVKSLRAIVRECIDGAALLAAPAADKEPK
jgi:hypothetical protein